MNVNQFLATHEPITEEFILGFAVARTDFLRGDERTAEELAEELSVEACRGYQAFWESR